MAVTLTFHGHSAFSVRDGGTNVLIDPFFTGNPKASGDPATIECDAICCTHGHEDHVGDVLSIARRTGATLYAGYEVCMWAGQYEVENLEPMNPGGRVKTAWGSVAMTPAIHSASYEGREMGCAAGLVIEIGGVKVYHLGDTALFSDLKLMGELYKPDVALVPVGDRFTMGPEHGKIAAEWVGAPIAVPMHYGTFPLLTDDISAFKPEGVEVRVMESGDSLSVG